MIIIIHTVINIIASITNDHNDNIDLEHYNHLYEELARLAETRLAQNTFNYLKIH